VRQVYSQGAVTNFEYLWEISDAETRYRLDERAAIQEYDGQLPRPEAEARAVDEVFPLPAEFKQKELTL
jgi:hypothetical protein